MDSLFVALRYLLARPITLVSLLGVLLGIGSIVVVDSVMNGFLGMQKQMIRGTHADVAVRVPRDLRPDAGAVETALETVRATDGVAAASLRIASVSMFRRPGGMNLQGLRGFGGFHVAELLGVDADQEPKVSRFAEFLDLDSYYDKLEVADPGRPFWFDPEDAYWRERVDPAYIDFEPIPVLFGLKLAALHDLRVGSIVSLATWSDVPDEEGHHQPRTRLFVVCGAFQTRDVEIDHTRAMVDRESLRDFGGLEAYAHEVVLAVAPGADETAVRDRLRRKLEPRGIPADHVETWADRKAPLLRAVQNERSIMNFVLFFMVIVAAFNLLVTLYMMVTEKVRDVGVLTSLGTSAARVARLFLICGLLVTCAGLVLGVSAGLLLTAYINPVHDFVSGLTGVHLFNPQYYVFLEIPADVDYRRIGLFSVAALLCTTFFTLFPSLRAARLDPVEALRRV